MIRYFAMYGIVVAAYSAVCTITDTWQEAPISLHITCLSLGAIGIAGFAIIREKE